MSIELSSNTVAVWFMSVNATTDFLAALVCIDADNKLFRFDYRFKYYNSEKPFDDKDRSNWYGGTISKHTKEEVLTKLRAFVKVLEDKTGNKADELLMRDGDLDAFMVEFTSKPWAHLRSATLLPDPTTVH